MFQRCGLFKNMPLNKLEFIINNTKPMKINISQAFIKEGDPVEHVYLVSKGQISVWKNTRKPGPGTKQFSSVQKIKDPR